MNKRIKVVRKVRVIYKYIFITLLSVLLLCVIPYYNYKHLEEIGLLPKEITRKAKIEYTFESNKTPKEIFAEANNISIENVKETSINDNYLLISANIDDNIKSEIVNIESNTIENINSVIKKDKEKEWEELIVSKIKLKYPEFISSVLISEDTIKNYEFSDSGVNIYFSNYSTTPVYEDKTNIELTCNMINDLLDFDCNLDNPADPNLPNLNSSKKTVALTFDDGPSTYTSEILEILSNNKANATFFVLGYNTKVYTDTLKKIITTGNEIGSHTYSHKNLIKCSTEDLDYELNSYSINLSNTLNYNVKLVRPPYGNINENIKNNYNYSYIMWSLDTLDWQSKNKDKIKETILNKVTDGDIILLHDIHKSSLEALKEVLPELYIRGYQVVTVSKLADIKNITLETNKVYRKF